MIRLFIILFVSLLFVSCKEKTTAESVFATGNKTILIQPFRDISAKEVKTVAEGIKKIYPYVKILDPADFPDNSFYAPRQRYRADSIIKSLQAKTTASEVIIGLTTKDISVTKGKNPDFGVMGLGYRPGRACVASTFRLNTKNRSEQFYKVAIHELGHTQGLHHCPVKTCFMRDAEGGNPTDELTDFCEKCKKFLQTKNWKFT